MKQNYRTMLAVLALDLVPSVNAEPENNWVRVEGGSWIPDTEITSNIREKIELFVGAQANTIGRQLREWKSYTFQYQGRGERGKKFVFINAFCVNDSRWQLNKQMVVVLDGRTCFFNLKYDLEKNQFFELLINGEA